MSVSEVLGLSGAAISGYAYLPQIMHLIRERYSPGLSERAFTLWLIASALVTFHAVMIGALVSPPPTSRRTRPCSASCATPPAAGST